MFGPTRYLRWAWQFFGKTEHDLASSGTPPVGAVEPRVVDDQEALPVLRAAMARYNDVPEASVVPALGTSHAIFLTYAALLAPGDEVLVETPGYEPLTRAALGLGARVRTFERPETEGFAVDPARIAAAMTPRTRVVVVSTLHNPSGVRVPDEVLREVAAVAEARGAYLLVDEVYAPFDALPRDGVFRTSARKLAPNIVAIGSLTKAYGLGYQRVGWLLGGPEVVDEATNAVLATVGHYPTAWAAHGAGAFDAIPGLVDRSLRDVAAKRALAERWVKSIPRAGWSAPREGLYGLVTLRGRGDLTERIEQHARTAGVLVGPGAFFGAPESFRLSWATARTIDRFEDALARLTPLVDDAARDRA